MKTYKIAIVGAGPSGYFTAQALQNAADDERNFKIDLDRPEFMFEQALIYPEYTLYKNWNKLIKKIASI